jgi:signal transduction histidine kinase
MNSPDFRGLDFNIARGRIALSLLAMLSLYIDPSTAGGMFHLSRLALITLLCHLAYSVAIFLTLRRQPNNIALSSISTAFDLFFATAVAFLTEGQTSPAYVFFVFAIVAAGVRPGQLSTIAVTIFSVVLYLMVILLSDRINDLYAMRAVYLAIAGYLIGFVGRQRAAFEARVRELETRAERHSIARSLHDGYIQALAGVNLRVQTCRELLERQRPDEALVQLTDLQTGIAREYDEVRAYIRELAGVDVSSANAVAVTATVADPHFEVRMAFSGHSTTGEHLLQIMLEGLRNARRHGMPQCVTIHVNGLEDKLRLTIDDDGVGFPESGNPPWAISSRVAELGGNLKVNHNGVTRIEIEMPNN